MRLRHDKRGVSNVIVVMLSLVILVIISANVILWSYQMNQLDWEKIQEDINIVDVTCVTETWSYNPSGFALGGSTSNVSGSVSDLTSDDSVYMTFRSYYSGTDTSDFVDQTCDLYAPSAKGTHSDFSAQQAGPESTYDTLEEENTEAIEDYVDQQSDIDSSSDLGSHDIFNDLKATDSTYDNMTEVEVGGEDTWEWSETVPGGYTSTSSYTQYIFASDYTPSSSYTATRIGFYAFADPQNNPDVKLAIYNQSGGEPDQVLGETAIFQITGSGWFDVDLTTAVELSSGVTYSVAHITEDAPTTQWRYSEVATPVSDYYTLTSWPDFDEGVDWLQSGSYRYGAYRVGYATGGDYQLDLEVQFTNVVDFLPTEKLCIYAGALGDEDLRVDYWNGSEWENISTDLTLNSWNNYTVSLISTTFTIRFKGGNETGDTTQDQWQIDASLLRVGGAGSKEDAVDQQSNVDGPADIGTHSNFTAQQYGPDSTNDTLTEADTSASDNNNVDSEIVTHGSATGISDAQTVDGITENITEGAIVGATPALESYEVNEANAVTSISVNKPSGTSSGDLLIILLGVDGATPQPSTPTGFTYIATWYAANSHIQCSWYREADGTEGTNFSSDWSGGSTEDAVMACLRITGWDSGDFPHKIATDDATSGDPVFPAVTTGKDNCLLLRWYGMDDDDDTEPIGGVPSGHDEIFARATTSFDGETTLSACNRTWATAGDTGAATWNQAATFEGWNTVTLAIAPEVVGYQLDVEHVVNSIAQHENYNLTIRAYRSAENFYLQLYNFSSSQWVNMSTVTASSLAWYNTTLVKADFVNGTNQARIRYWQGAGAAQETLYVDYSGVYGWNATNYELDLEVQWTDVPYLLPNENLSIYGGTTGDEDIKVDVWNGTDWENVFTDLSSGWNNASITNWLTSSNFTIRFKGGNETGDPSRDTWNVDVALIHIWNTVENYELDLEVQWASVDYDETNEELCIKTGIFSGSEDLQVKVRSGGSWVWVMNLTANQWNNVSVTSYLTGSTFTIQFLGGTETSDSTRDNWDIDVTLLHVWSDKYTMEVEFIGSSNTEDWTQLNWTIDSAWTIGSVDVTLQLYNYTLDGYPTSGNGYMSYTSNATANTDETKNQTITVNPTSFRNATGYWKMKVKGVKATDTQFDFKADWIEYKATKAGGTSFTSENTGSLTSHLVSLWINNATHHQRYDTNIFINSGDTESYIRSDVTLPNKPYTVKVVTERGNTAVFASH